MPREPSLVVATSNAGKLREIRAILGDLPLELVGLAAVPEVRLPEEGGDYAANAEGKARAVAEQAGRAAVGDDSGIEVAGLDGGPGPYSARYGGPGLDDAGRVAHLLTELRGVRHEGRRARFVCVAALATPDGRCVVRRGECAGWIREEPVGAGGFGYDPVFEVDAIEAGGRTMAELGEALKNRLSHRARAFRALEDDLRRLL
ncbi:MAG: non-canonical purine NTP pyrophosphatase [Myxococcota bacterium]|nr:non-canonical purine NTP pyrophosphatase [Myxococcota bacterium]